MALVCGASGVAFRRDDPVPRADVRPSKRGHARRQGGAGAAQGEAREGVPAHPTGAPATPARATRDAASLRRRDAVSVMLHLK